MPINRRSQSRRSHLEEKSKQKTRDAFGKQEMEGQLSPIKEANKKKRGGAKKR